MAMPDQLSAVLVLPDTPDIHPRLRGKIWISSDKRYHSLSEQVDTTERKMANARQIIIRVCQLADTIPRPTGRTSLARTS